MLKKIITKSNFDWIKNPHLQKKKTRKFIKKIMCKKKKKNKLRETKRILKTKKKKYEKL